MAFASPELEAGWHYIEVSLDGIIAATAGLDEAGLDWRPAEDANSLYVLAVHTMGSIGEAMRMLVGESTDRDRDAEFAAEISVEPPLGERWAKLGDELRAKLSPLQPEALNAMYEHPRHGPISGHDVLIRSATHAAEHHGHAALTRELLDRST